VYLHNCIAGCPINMHVVIEICINWSLGVFVNE